MAGSFLPIISKKLRRIGVKMNETKLLNIDEAAAYLRIKKPTLYSWVFQKKIPYI